LIHETGDMELIPAIDIRNGRCVRLLKGDFGQETRYEADPVTLAEKYRALGARWLHVVDLDGAASGRPVNLPLIRRMAGAGLKVQLGGGIRDEDSLAETLTIAERVVIGSLAVTAPETVSNWLKMHGPERITLALDVKLSDGGVAFVKTHGWTRASELTLDDAIGRYIRMGLRHVLCTDIDRDGALAGPNIELYQALAARWPAIAVQASGGVRNPADLAALNEAGAAAAISGKALLEGYMPAEEIRPYLPNA
jgi:phosphoribosylformimino-5-aminoimidazole carboxamide ribotide isomerase